MFLHALLFILGLGLLLLSARFFTRAAEKIGAFIGFPEFVIGVFIVGIGTSLPELISAILSVHHGVSEIVSGNVIGANISNLLLLTGLVAVINRQDIVLGSKYIFIDLHFLLGGFFMFTLFCVDGKISFGEGVFGIIGFLIYSFYLIYNERQENHGSTARTKQFPALQFVILVAAATGIYFGAELVVNNLASLAKDLNISASIVALTVLSLGTTLPELAVNISAIREGKAEMAIGNVLGSCVFNAMGVAGIASVFGSIEVPAALQNFSLPVMLSAGLFFYLLTHDKRMSPWEGALFVLLYALFIFKITVA
ncbi:MAG: calcium/sodium antiporter [Chitinophagales bacterium]|nr:calcium/sodium antiporter [Chitinophagales bacterium]MDW8418124.1 calcium/sodium antiporter [Chitinophagales bacterium]